MANYDKNRDEKLKYDINRESARISAWPSGKIDKYKWFTSEEILPTNQSQKIEQAKFRYSTLRKTFEKETEQVGALKFLNPSN